MGNICIISLGWLGLALHQKLTHQGFDVVGSFLNSPKNVKGEFQFDINSRVIPEVIKESELIILCLPPSCIKDEAIFIDFLTLISTKHLIFISSTSVYGDQGIVDETTTPTPENQNGKRLLKWEKLIIKSFKKYHIIRSAGQYGQNRHPANFLSGKVGVTGKDSPVNLISQFDLIKITAETLNLSESLIINAVNTDHPTKVEFYTKICNQRNLKPPIFISEGQKSKTVKTIHSQFTVRTSLYKGNL